MADEGFPFTFPGTPGSLITSRGNLSGIICNTNKALNFPPNWNEIDGYSEEGNRNEQRVVRVFLGPWTDRWNFISYMMGSSTSIPAATGSVATLSRDIPHQHPEYPWLYAVGYGPIKGEGEWNLTNPFVFMQNPDGTVLMNAQGEEVINPIIYYHDKSLGAATQFQPSAQVNQAGDDSLSCVVPITYGQLEYEVYADDEIKAYNLTELNRWVSREEVDSYEQLPLPTGTLVFVLGTGAPHAGKAIDVNAAVLKLPRTEVVYTWHDVPDIPYAAFKACRNCVNLNPFDPQITINGKNVGGYQVTGYEAQSLLMQAPRRRRHRNSLGRVVWDIEYHFLYNPLGWNVFPDSDGNFYQAVFANAQGQPVIGATLYKVVDFMDPIKGLFTQPNPPVSYQGPLG
jgi:hypothetical protein